MNLARQLNPMNWFGGGGKGALAGAVTTRTGGSLGPHTGTEIDSYVAREVNPYLYEAIREARGGK